MGIDDGGRTCQARFNERMKHEPYLASAAYWPPPSAVLRRNVMMKIAVGVSEDLRSGGFYGF
jgi:hypothetical protein